MDASKILSVLYSEIHSVVVGMIDSVGHPSSAFLDVMFAEENAVYFMTSDNGRNLYHLLNHLNLFGGSYLYSVLSIVRRYI